MMTYRQIESSRERRLWITQVVMPTVLVAAAILGNREVREDLKDKVTDIKEKIKAKINK